MARNKSYFGRAEIAVYAASPGWKHFSLTHAAEIKNSSCWKLSNDLHFASLNSTYGVNPRSRSDESHSSYQAGRPKRLLLVSVGRHASIGGILD